MIVAIIALVLLSRGFCQNNAEVSFSVYVDRQAPAYDNYSISNFLINEVNESFTLSSQWTDDNKLGYYKFEWNITGAYENETMSYNINWANITKTIASPVYEGKNVSMRIHATDVSNNWNSTEYQTIIINSIPPEYSNVNINNTNPIAGDSILISSYWTDNFEIDHVNYQTNETGTWLDNGTPFTLNNKTGWANYTIDTTGMTNGNYFWRLLGEDQIGNTNASPINYFTIQ